MLHYPRFRNPISPLDIELANARAELAFVNTKIADYKDALARQYGPDPSDWPDTEFEAIERLRASERDPLVDKVTDLTRQVIRQAATTSTVVLPGSGHYPDLLQDMADQGRCRGSDVVVEGRTRLDGGEITHTSCDGRSYHLFQFALDNGQVVAGLTLKAGRPWRGYQSAVIDRVFTASPQRRKGYAARLLVEARRYFRRVKHSKDLTDAGRAWSRYTK